MTVPTVAEVEHAPWPALKEMASSLGLNPNGRSAVVRRRVMDHVRRRARPEAWRASPVHQAAFLNRLGFPEVAARIWESTVRLDAAVPWIGLGRAHLLAGNLPEAGKAFDRAAQMGDASAHLARAETLAAEGNFDGAVRACDAFLAARPDDVRGIALKAGFLARAGWPEEAAGLLRRSFEGHPQMTELWRGLGRVLLSAERPEVAAEAYHEVVRADPSDAGAWANRGAALLLAGHAREAIGALRESLELDPTRAETLNDLGVAYLREGHGKSAIVNLERAAKHLEIPGILANLAKAYEAGHLRAQAAEARARARRLRAPPEPTVPEALPSPGEGRRRRPAPKKPRRAPRKPRPAAKRRVRAKPRRGAKKSVKAVRKTPRRARPSAKRAQGSRRKRR